MIVRELFAKFGFAIDEQSMREANTRFERFKRRVSEGAREIRQRLRNAFSMKRIIAGLAAAGVAAFAFVQQMAKVGDRLDKDAKSMGIAASTLFQLEHALGLGGVSAEQLATSMRALTNQVRAARNGSKEAQNAFQSLGVSMQDLERLSPDELLLRVGGALGDMENPTLRNAFALQLLGEAGTKVAAAFEGGSDAIRAQMRDLERFLSTQALDEYAQKSAEVSDSLAKLKVAGQALSITLFNDVAPSFNAGIEEMTRFLETAAKTGQGLGQLKAIVAAFAATAAAIAAVIAPVATAVAAVGASTAVAINQIDRALDGQSTFGGDLVERAVRFLNEEAGFRIPGFERSESTDLTDPAVAVRGVLASGVPAFPPPLLPSSLPAPLARSTTNNNTFHIRTNNPQAAANEVVRQLDRIAREMRDDR